MFHMENVVLRYGDLTVLDQFNLCCEERQFICLFGPSGVGKTSVLNILAGINKPQAGSVKADYKRLAYVFQEPRLLPWLTVEQNLKVGLFNLGLNSRQRNQCVSNLLPLLGLSGFGGYYPGQLSGGMKQRVSLGRAFAIQPDLLLLDEPFTGLDENLKTDMLDLLFSLGQWHACTTVMVTHDIKEVIKISDRIVVMAGRPCRIVQDIVTAPEQRRDPAFIRKTEAGLVDMLNPNKTCAVL